MGARLKREFFTLKNTAVLVLLFLHFFAILYWNVSWDSYTHDAMYDKVRWYVQYTGLWQNWEMFGPNPPTHAVNVRIVGNTDEQDVIYEPRYMRSNWFFTRDRKFHENILDKEPEALSYYLDYWCDRMNEKNNVTTVTFLVQKQPITPFLHDSVRGATYKEQGSWLCDAK